MKIALISQVATPGLLIFRKPLIQELVAAGHELYCFSADFSDDTRKKIVDLGGIPIDYSLSRTGLNPFRDLLDTLKLVYQLKDLKLDMVISFFAKPVIYGSVAAKLAGVPKRIGMLEGLGFTFTQQPGVLPFKTRLIRWVQVQLYRVAIPMLDKIIFLNPDDPVDLIDKYNIKAKKVDVLGGIGLDLNEYPYCRPEKGKIRFIFVGRLLAEKGINEYIAAAKLIKQQYSEIEFVVLGGLDEGNPGGLKQPDLDKLKAEDIIIHPGHVSNVSQWVADSSVFVLPSYREGVPRSTQEAMAIGRAVITTDMPGCRETVDEGVNGFMVQAWNAKALAQAMLRFIEQPELIELMGLESHRIAQEKFDARVVNQRLIKLLGCNID